MKYGLSEEQLKQILDIIASYDEIEEAILFGSRAIDTYKEASDVDIAIKGKKVTASLAAKLKYRFEEDTYLPFFFDFVAYPTIINESLKKHIDTKGVSIYRAGWKECKLGDLVFKIGSGATPRGGSNDYKDDGTSLIRSQNVLDFSFSFSGLAFIDDEQADGLKNVTVEKNDVLLNITGDSVARCCIVPAHVLPARVNQHVAIIRLNPDKADYRYIFYFLQALKEELLMQAEIGATRKALTKVMIEQIGILLPPLPEQKAIASVLSSLDDKIDLLHHQNKTLEAIAETLFRQWFMEQAETDDVATLGEFAQNIKENARVENLQKYDHYVGLEHIPRKSIALTNWGKPDKLESNKSVFAERDILFGKLRAYFHKIVFTPIDGVCSTDILVIRPKKKEWFSFCLFWFFNTDVVEHSDLGSGGTRMPITNWEILSGYQIPRPSYQRISEFDKIVRPMTENITFNILQIRTIKKLRDTLLPKLMSGEVRVTV